MRHAARTFWSLAARRGKNRGAHTRAGSVWRPRRVSNQRRTMRQIKLGRTGIGIAVFACAVALAAPAALAIRATISTPANPGPGNIASGQTLFNEQFCAACHTLKAAGADAYGQLGVNLNEVKGGVPFETAKAVVPQRPPGCAAALSDPDGRVQGRPDATSRSTTSARSSPGSRGRAWLATTRRRPSRTSRATARPGKSKLNGIQSLQQREAPHLWGFSLFCTRMRGSVAD